MSQLLSPALVGREEALAEVRRLVGSAERGNGGVLVIRGEPGVGKSRLARAAVDEALERGMATLQGRTTPVGAPLRAFTHAFLAHGRHHPIPDDPQLAAFRGPLSVVLPEWRDASVVLPEQPLPLVAEGIVRLLRSTSPRGVLIALEDVHWADAETIHVLDHVADSAVSEHIAVVVTMRPTEGPASAWASDAGSRRTARTLELGRLTARETVALVQACLGSSSVPASLVDHICESSDGLPLLVEDLLASLIDSAALVRRSSGWEVTAPLRVDVPRSFAQLVTERLSTLDDSASRVLASAAVLGRTFEWHLLPEVTGQSRAEVLAALRSGVAAQLVMPDHSTGPDQFTFRHALTRDVVLSGLLPPERAALAAAAATAIERTWPDLPGDWLSIAASLHAEGGDARRAAHLLIEAGRRALDTGALPSAETALRRARRLVDDQGTLDSVDAGLTEMLALAGRVAEASTVGESLLARGPERTLADTVHLRLARAMLAAGDLDRAEQHLTGVEGPARQSPEVEVLRAALALARGRVDLVVPLAGSALEAAESGGQWAMACEALEILGRAARRVHATLGEEYFERAHRIAEGHDLALWRGRALHELGTIDLMESGRRDRLEGARLEAENDGDLVTVAHVDLHLGLLLAHRSDLEGARRALESAEQLARQLGLLDLRRVAIAQLGYALALNGERAAARSCLTTVRADRQSDSARHVADGLAEPFCLLLEDDRPAAVAVLDEAVRALADGSWPQWGVRALLHSVAGDDEALAEAHQRAGEPGPQRLIRAYLQFARAVSLGREGDHHAAVAAFEDADRSLGWQTAHRPFCYRHVAEAALRDGWGDPVPWLVSAAEALPAAASFGRACRRLVRASGAPVPRRGRGDAVVPDDLRRLGVTSREVDVLMLVAEGLGNRGIAERLHLSPRTVESHVARLLSKTGATARADLRALVNSGETGD